MVERVVMIRGRNTGFVHGSTQAEHGIEQDDDLLPGMRNEITLEMIAPKLPWRTIYMLALVSRGWQRAVRSRQVYDARLRSKIKHTLVPFHCLHCDYSYKIGLYCVEDGTCFHLPKIPGVRAGIPGGCKLIPLDGKVYVLGGWKETTTSDVYVFDLAGQRQWKECASMRDARKRFGCGVKDGKIYVFGGHCESEILCASEVYDPKEDAWSPITPVPSFRFNHKVTMAGDELFLHNGQLSDSLSGHVHDALSAEVYHPGKDEWRIVERFSRSSKDNLVLLGGKLHRLNHDSTEVYDIDANSWKSFMPFSIGTIYDAVAVDQEILAVVKWTMAATNRTIIGDIYDPGTCFIKIQGVGGKNTKIFWQRLQCSFDLEGIRPSLCSPFQL